jgi:Domain of unknown function (DUF1330)
VFRVRDGLFHFSRVPTGLGTPKIGSERRIGNADVGMEKNMSAYVVVESTVKDPQAMERYVKAPGPIIKSFGG